MKTKNAAKPGYRTVHVVHGVHYIYECVSTYDKEKKQSFNTQVCIGKQGPDGSFIPNAYYRERHQLSPTGEKITVVSKAIGATETLTQIAKAEGLERCLTLSLGKDVGSQALALAEYILIRGSALSHFPEWAAHQKLPQGAQVLSSQDLSRFLDTISDDMMENFFTRWASNFTGHDTICLDLTSVSSYSACNELVKYGYNRDHEQLEQVNILGLFSATKMLPVAVRMLPGNIADVSTLVNELTHFTYLGLSSPVLLLDQGFDSEENLTRLLDRRLKFIMMAHCNRAWLTALEAHHRDSIRVPSKLFYYQDDRYYAVTECLSLGSDKNRRCYAHIYYCARLAEKHLDRFNERLHGYYDQLVAGASIATIPVDYQKYFSIKETPKRGRLVILDEEAAVATEKSFSAMFVILSNAEKDAQSALRLYRERDAAEKFFDDMKNTMDMDRLRVHTSPRAKARLFLQYLSTILLYLCRNKLGMNASSTTSVRGMLEDLSGICEVTHSNHYGSMITESTSAQRALLAQLGIDTSSWLQN